MNRIYFRSLEMADLDRIHQWHSDPALYSNLGSPFRFVSHSAEEEWLKKRSAFSRDEVNLAICVTETRDHIGNIYLRDVDWIARKAELHIFIGDASARSQGYGKEAVAALVRHAFIDLGLQRVYLTVLATNIAAIKTYEGCGFQVEGRLRRHFIKQGEFVDALFMGVCACDIERNMEQSP